LVPRASPVWYTPLVRTFPSPILISAHVRESPSPAPLSAHILNRSKPHSGLDNVYLHRHFFSLERQINTQASFYVHYPGHRSRLFSTCFCFTLLKSSSNFFFLFTHIPVYRCTLYTILQPNIPDTVPDIALHCYKALATFFSVPIQFTAVHCTLYLSQIS
jgi:hypothetical protein